VWSALNDLYSTQSKARVFTMRYALANTKNEDLIAALFISKIRDLPLNLLL
jgi:hypothetical protein